MEEIKKSFSGALHVADAERDIDLINQYALKKMTPDEVFAFNVNLCDDQQDRDLEKFSVHALQQMAKLFPGKPMLSDHSWSALRQIGRIYKADVVQDKGVNRLRGSVYMIRSDSTNDIISSIEAGVLKEVSVGCRCRKHTCSECGEGMGYDFMKGGYYCKNGHRKGDKGKDGKPILTVLDDVTDCYELSFVAVPVQPEAGTTKGKGIAKELSQEEMEWRKQIFERNNRVLASFGINAEKKSHDYLLKDCPMEPGNLEDIAFAILPDSIVKQNILDDAKTAIAFVRKDLDLPNIKIRWFATEDDARKIGLKDYQVFYNQDTLLGTIDKEANDRIYVRYYGNQHIIKTILHEAYHICQRFKNCAAEYDALEEYAYMYASEKIHKVYALTKSEIRDLIVEMAMKE